MARYVDADALASMLDQWGPWHDFDVWSMKAWIEENAVEFVQGGESEPADGAIDTSDPWFIVHKVDKRG